MTSQRQINANRRNAAFGGPKTGQGRAPVKFNRVSHGLCAVTPVLPGEDSEAFEQLRSNLFQEYQPAGETERVLVEEFALCSWPLVRLRRVETQTWTRYIFSVLDSAGAGSAPTEQALAAGLHETDPKKLVNFFRYERTTTRDFYRVLQELKALQKERHRSERLSAAQPASQAAPQPVPLAAAAGSASVPAAQAVEPAHTIHHPTPAPTPAPELSENGIGTVLQPHPDNGRPHPRAAQPEHVGDPQPQHPARTDRPLHGPSHGLPLSAA